MLQPVELHANQVLHECGRTFSSHVYFPITSMVSVVVSMQDGVTTDVAAVGNEGFTGAEMLIGAESPINSYVCQIPGQALRMSVSEFQGALRAMPDLHLAASGYLQLFIYQIAQAGFCNIAHAWEGRFARLLLLVQDRTGKDALDLSREPLADMLNLQRQSVSLMAGAFNMAGLIEYQDGHLRIVNRQGLEEVSCEC